MTVDTIYNILVWIIAFTLLVLTIIVAFGAIFIAIKVAWDKISQHIDHYVFFNPKPIETEDDKIKKRLNECKRKIKLLEEFKASLATNGIIIDGVVYAYKKAKLETKDGTICTTCALNEICNSMNETITCSVFKGSDEDGCHFERI